MFTVRVAPVRLCSCSGENISLESPLPKWQRLCVNGGKRASELFLERASISDLSSTRSPPQPNPTQHQQQQHGDIYYGNLYRCIASDFKGITDTGNMPALKKIIMIFAFVKYKIYS